MSIFNCIPLIILNKISDVGKSCVYFFYRLFERNCFDLKY